MPDRVPTPEKRDDPPARLTAWCATCRASQPCAPGGPPYHCAVCGAHTPNAILRLAVRHAAPSPPPEPPQRCAAD